MSQSENLFSLKPPKKINLNDYYILGRNVHLKEDMSINEYLDKKGILVLSFHTHWSGPSKAYKKILSEMSEKYPNIHFLEVGIDEFKDLQKQFKVEKVPYTLFYKNGILLNSHHGLIKRLEMIYILEVMLSNEKL